MMEFGVLCVTRFDFTKDIAKQFTSHLLFINILSKTYHSFMYSHWVFFLINMTMFVYILNTDIKGVKTDKT